jgi:hypothetical protein
MGRSLWLYTSRLVPLLLSWKKCGLGRSPAATKGIPHPHVNHCIGASGSNGNKSRPNATRMSIVQGTVHPSWPPGGAGCEYGTHEFAAPQQRLFCVNTLVPGGHKRHCIVKTCNMHKALESEIIYCGETEENIFFIITLFCRKCGSWTEQFEIMRIKS